MAEPGPQGQIADDLVDLLVKQVTEGLSPAERRTLDAADSAPLREALRGLERAAAALTIAGTATLEVPPAALQERLMRQAEEHVGSVVDDASPPLPSAAAPPGAHARSATHARRGGYAGWLAAAACLVLAVMGWWRSPPQTPLPRASLPPVTVPPPVAPKAPLTAAEQRDLLLAMPGVLKVALAPTKDPAGAGVTGEVVWDPSSQRGFITFVGLKPNDPQSHEYQIWIFDAARDQRYPVDGGVFDVAGGGEVVIPIHAALRVQRLAAFAVTLEKPGGVVVSARDHVVVLGAAG